MNYHLSAQESAYLTAFTVQSQSADHPESLTKAMAAYLNGEGSLASIHDAWQSVQSVQSVQSTASNSNGYQSFRPTFRQEMHYGERLTPFGARLLDIAIATSAVQSYLWSIAKDGPMAQAVEYLRSHDISEDQVITWAATCQPFVIQDTVSTPEDEDEEDWDEEDPLDVSDQQPQSTPWRPSSLGSFFLSYAAHNFDHLQQVMGYSVNEDFWSQMVFLLANATHLELASAILQQLSPDYRCYCLPSLLPIAPSRFRALIHATLSDTTVAVYRKRTLLEAVIQCAPAEHRDLLEGFVRDYSTILSWRMWNTSSMQSQALETLYRLDVQTTLPLSEECLDAEDAEIATQAIRLLAAGAELSSNGHATRLEQIVAKRPMKIALAATKELLDHPWEGRTSFANTLLAHRHQKVREAAIHWYQDQGADSFELLIPLLTHRSAEIRLTVLTELHQADNARAADLLVKHYASEKSLKVKQALEGMMPTVAESAAASGESDADDNDTISTAITSVSAELTSTASKRWQQPSWFDWSTMPQAQWEHGEPIAADIQHGLLYRQSRMTKMQLDAQVRRAAALMNRASVASLAQVLFKRWVADGSRTKYKWVLPLIAALADDSLVPELRERINKQRKGTQSLQTAITLTQLLAQIGTPLALSEVRDLTRSAKKPAIRRNARMAFAETTRSLNISLEDVDDDIVPRLGFDVSGKQILIFGSRQLAIQLGQHLDLQLWDSGEQLLQVLPHAKASDDKTATAQAKQHWQHLKKQKQQLATTQSIRLDQACSRRRVWNIARWRQLFLEHPVLHSLGMAYIWVALDATDASQQYFRVANDSLVNCDDKAVTLPENGLVRLAHPLEMSTDLCDRWLEHLAEYEIAPLMPQLDRPTYALTDAERNTSWWTREQGRVLLVSDLMTIAQRTGWELPDPDSDSFDLLYKTFPEAGVEAILSVGNVWSSNYRYATTPIIGLGFLPIGTIAARLSSQAGEGADEDDADDDTLDKHFLEANAMPLKDVAAIVLSEAISDVAALGAKGTYDPNWQAH